VIAFVGSVLVLVLVRSRDIRTHTVPADGFDPVPEAVAA
jgi:hypothetical protein